MERRQIPADPPYDAVWGYSRAVVAGDRIHVSGTTAGADPPDDPYAQARRALERILAALAQVGAGSEHVVRTRIFVRRFEDLDEVARAHAEVFGNVRPAATAVVVQGFVDAAFLVEIEADAIVPEARSGP